LFFALTIYLLKAEEWIRINQLGYLPVSYKVAVLMSEEGVNISGFFLKDAYTDETVQTFTSVKEIGSYGQMKTTYRL